MKKSLLSTVKAINHGVTTSFLDEVHNIGRYFFALPIKETIKWLRIADDVEGSANDIVLTEHRFLDWIDRVYPENFRRR